MSNVTVLEAHDLAYAVGQRPVLEHITLEVQAGKFYALVGPNGAGKTTLLRLLAGELRPSSGVVLIQGQPVQALSTEELARRRAVLSQQTVVQFAFTAWQVVEMGRAPHWRRVPPATDNLIIRQALERTGALSLADRVYPTLSGGEQELVQLSRVLAQEAPLILLDEPAAALDLHRQALLIRIIKELQALGVAVIAVLHDFGLASIADELWLLHRGRLVASGPPDAVLSADQLESVFGCALTVVPVPQAQRILVVPIVQSPTAKGEGEQWNAGQ